MRVSQEHWQFTIASLSLTVFPVLNLFPRQVLLAKILTREIVLGTLSMLACRLTIFGGGLIFGILWNVIQEVMSTYLHGSALGVRFYFCPLFVHAFLKFHHFLRTLSPVPFLVIAILLCKISLFSRSSFLIW